jgi:hypothetical protein
VDRSEEIACGKISLYFVKLMQQLLKPELVRLMDDDEQRLIVFRRAGAGFLKRQQFLQVQITSVRKRRHVLMLAATACRFNPPPLAVFSQHTNGGGKSQMHALSFPNDLEAD